MEKVKKKQYWILKTEPDTFSIQDLCKKGAERWDGVRNFQARNNLRAMHSGDVVFIYHSSIAEPGIVGEGVVSETAYPDPLQFDTSSKYYDSRSKAANPLWSAVTVSYTKTYKYPVMLSYIKSHRSLSQMSVAMPGTRLSVLPVGDAHAVLIRSKSTSAPVDTLPLS